MNNSTTSFAEALLGLDGFVILEVNETCDELIINVETKNTFAAVQIVQQEL